jgi:hypothetical protein
MDPRGFVIAHEGTLQVTRAAAGQQAGVSHAPACTGQVSSAEASPAAATCPTVFVAGDLRSKTPLQRMASYAKSEGRFIARQIMQLENAPHGQPRLYRAMPRILSVSIGPNDGFLSVGGWTVLIGPVVPAFKSVCTWMWMHNWL